MADTKKYYQKVGRRKESIARVRVIEGNAPITVNGKQISEVYKSEVFQRTYQKPFELVKVVGKYTATIKVEGGGVASQLGAIVHGLSRALSEINPEYRSVLKSNGMLTRDPRAKERRKYGLAHAARAQKSSPKR